MFGISLKKMPNWFLRIVKIFSGVKIRAIWWSVLARENIQLSKNTDYWVKIPIGLQSNLGEIKTNVAVA